MAKTKHEILEILDAVIIQQRGENGPCAVITDSFKAPWSVINTLAKILPDCYRVVFLMYDVEKSGN